MTAAARLRRAICAAVGAVSSGKHRLCELCAALYGVLCAVLYGVLCAVLYGVL